MLSNNKILLILILMIGGLIIALYAMSSTIVMNGFSGVEDQDTRQNVERVINALKDDQSGLNKSVNDWSAWDETYSFTLNRNDEFVTSFLYDEEFGLLDVNLIMIVNSSGQIFFVKSIDIEKMQEITFLNSSLEKFLIQDGGMEPSFSGIINVPEGLMMIAGRPILTSNGSGPSAGTLIMGRFFESKEINKLAETTRLAISASEYNDQKMPADFQAQLPLFKKGTDIVIGPLNEDIIAGYTLIRDIYGNPALVLRVDMPRFIYKQGRESLNYYLVSLLAVGLVFGVVVGSLLKKLTLWESKTLVSEEKYRALIETTDTGYLILDSGGKVLDANAEYVRLSGHESLNEIIGRSVVEWTAEYDRGRNATEVEKCSQQGFIRNLEIDYIDKQGHITPIEIQASIVKAGSTIQILSLCRDITERKRAEKALQDSEEKYRSLIDNIPDVIYTTASDGITVFISNTVEKVYGFTPQEIYQGGDAIWFGRIHPDDVETVKEKFRALIEERQLFEIEYRIQRKDERWIWLHDRAVATYEKGGIWYFDGIFTDITERKKAEETRLENLRLEAADKAKSEFLASMSHELRTPLTTILGFSELMKRGKAGKLAEKQERFIDNILTAGTFLLNLINEILDLSKIEAGKIDLIYEKVSLPETIKEILNLIKVKASEKNVLVNMDFDPELGFIEADKLRIKQILFNLLSNAVKFSKDEGGVVTIATKKEVDKAIISISDTGIGIKEENIGRLFHKFEQLDPETKQKYGGTGLGLAITRHLVELQGGEIKAQSTYGKGSTFTLIVPIEVKRKNE